MISRPHLDFEVLFFPGFSKCNLLGLLGGKRREDMAAAPLRSVLTFFFYFGFYFEGCSSSFWRLLHDVIPVRHDEVVALRVPWSWYRVKFLMLKSGSRPPPSYARTSRLRTIEATLKVVPCLRFTRLYLSRDILCQ